MHQESMRWLRRQRHLSPKYDLVSGGEGQITESCPPTSTPVLWHLCKHRLINEIERQLETVGMFIININVCCV